MDSNQVQNQMKLLKAPGKNRFMIVMNSRLMARGTITELAPIAIRELEYLGFAIDTEEFNYEMTQIGFTEAQIAEATEA